MGLAGRESSVRASFDTESSVAAYVKKLGHVSRYMGEYASMLPPGSRYLDLGCGPGNDANLLAGLGNEVVATDFSQSFLKYGRRKFPDIKFRKIDMTKIPLRHFDQVDGKRVLKKIEDNSFDGVVAGFSLTYLEKPEADVVFDEIKRILRPGGTFRLGLQEGESKETFEEMSFGEKESTFLNIYSEREAIELLEARGFVIEEIHNDPYKEGELPYNKLFIHARLGPRQPSPLRTTT